MVPEFLSSKLLLSLVPVATLQQRSSSVSLNSGTDVKQTKQGRLRQQW